MKTWHTQVFVYKRVNDSQRGHVWNNKEKIIKQEQK